MVQLPTQRQQSLISRVIEEYIHTAEPVSSRAIAASGYFDVRSATIRNEMADLEEMGYLTQLHTSGGRVPTARAYRLYVNELVAREGVTVSTLHKRRLDEALAETDRDPEAVNKTLARIVGQLSGALVMVNQTQRPDAYKVGLSNLMAFPEFHQFERMAGLTEFFDQFDAMADRMFQRMFGRDDTDVKVFIGAETPDERMKDETLICARYRLPDGHEGTLTLVGPMRMDYRRNLGLVTYAAQAANNLA